MYRRCGCVLGVCNLGTGRPVVCEIDMAAQFHTRNARIRDVVIGRDSAQRIFSTRRCELDRVDEILVIGMEQVDERAKGFALQLQADVEAVACLGIQIGVSSAQIRSGALNRE